MEVGLIIRKAEGGLGRLGESFFMGPPDMGPLRGFPSSWPTLILALGVPFHNNRLG